MRSLDVIIPFANPDSWRERELPFILSRITNVQPNAVFVIGSDKEHIENLPEFVTFAQIEGWSKPKAVNYAALNMCTSEWLFILDADVLLPFADVRNSLEEHGPSSRVIRPCNKIVRLDMKQTETLLRTGGDVKMKAKARAEVVVTGGAFLIQREYFLRLRGFDEKFDLYMEDTELKHRLAQSAGRVMVCSGAPGLHMYHIPTHRDIAKYMEMHKEKLKLSAFDRIAKTESCIPLAVDFNAPLPTLEAGLNTSKKVKPVVKEQRAKAAAGTFTPILTYDGNVTAAVQCHEQYLDKLENCMRSVDGQSYQPKEKILILDGCDLPGSMAARAKGWKVIRRNDGTPNPGRNAALEAAACSWLWYMDADDVANLGYLQGAVPIMKDRHVGIIHANLKYSDGKSRGTPAVTDYWGLRLKNYVSTESVWRTTALREAGGWKKTDRFDDWTCALNVTGCGWHTVRNPVAIEVNLHDAASHRNRTDKDFAHKWERTHAVLCLMAGRMTCWEEWSSTMLAMKYPARTHFYFLDNSRNVEYRKRLQDLLALLSACGHQTTLLVSNATFKEVDRYSRSCHVAALYNHLCSQVSEDTAVFWEDDNVPANSNSLHKLIDNWQFQSVGGICSLYETRNAKPGTACAARSMDFWDGGIRMADIRGKVVKGLGFLPGGFAVYHNAFVQQALPFHVDYPKGKADGWDGKLSRTVREQGFRLDLDGTVECAHMFKRA